MSISYSYNKWILRNNAVHDSMKMKIGDFILIANSDINDYSMLLKQSFGP